MLYQNGRISRNHELSLSHYTHYNIMFLWTFNYIPFDYNVNLKIYFEKAACIVFRRVCKIVLSQFESIT